MLVEHRAYGIVLQLAPISSRPMSRWRARRCARRTSLTTSTLRDQLKLALGKYAELRASGRAERRFAAATWGRHMSVLSLFCRWAMAEGQCAGRAVHLPDGPGAVRRDRPGGPGEPGGPPELARNSAIGELALATGMRRRGSARSWPTEFRRYRSAPVQVPISFRSRPVWPGAGRADGLG
jgi:hypothetical protein